MFLVDRLPSPPGLSAQLAPRQLFGGAADLIRGALTARPPAMDSGAARPLRHPGPQLDLALPQPAGRRKAG